ncbi:MAG: aldo/keto reductase [Candidatus Marinimicrobia bacterium]|nr:aldo/keto reductase [Candidatus Neomarinimicrobiota bacterium]
MQYRQLGQTDLMVSRICFGCWQLSPRFWGDVAVEPWEAAVRKALDVGVNFIDTADAYGDGAAEAALGNLLASEGLRDRFILATKFLWNFEGPVRYPDTSYDYILRACEASLKRLRTDRIDLYQMHRFDQLTRPEEVGAALCRLKQEGKIRWIGVSNLNVEQMRMYQRHVAIDCLQPPYSLLARDVEQHELPYCLAGRIGVIAYSPLFRGLLTGKYAPGHVFTDSRQNVKYFQGAAFKRISAAVASLKPLAEEHGLTLAQLAVRWVLTHPALTSAIVGIKHPGHIEGIVAAAEDMLPAADWHHMADTLLKARNE